MYGLNSNGSITNMEKKNQDFIKALIRKYSRDCGWPRRL